MVLVILHIHMRTDPRLMSDESSRSQDHAAIHQDVAIHLTPLNYYLLATFWLLNQKNSVSAVVILDPHLRVRVVGTGIPRQDNPSHGIVRASERSVDSRP